MPYLCYNSDDIKNARGERKGEKFQPGWQWLSAGTILFYSSDSFQFSARLE